MALIEATRAALVGLWTPVLESEGVQVVRGVRQPWHGPDVLSVGNAGGPIAPVTMGARRQMEQQLDVACTLSCSGQGNPEAQGVLDARVDTLLTLAEETLRSVAGMNLGVNTDPQRFLVSAYVSQADYAEGEADESGAYNATIQFTVRALGRYRLT